MPRHIGIRVVFWLLYVKKLNKAFDLFIKNDDDREMLTGRNIYEKDYDTNNEHAVMQNNYKMNDLQLNDLQLGRTRC